MVIFQCNCCLFLCHSMNASTMKWRRCVLYTHFNRSSQSSDYRLIEKTKYNIMYLLAKMISIVFKIMISINFRTVEKKALNIKRLINDYRWNFENFRFTQSFISMPNSFATLKMVANFIKCFHFGITICCCCLFNARSNTTPTSLNKYRRKTYEKSNRHDLALKCKAVW